MFSCWEFPVFPWSAAFRGLSNNLPSDARWLRYHKQEISLLLKSDLLLFQIYKNKKKNLHGIGQMTQGDHFF